ncbi:MAG: hypothetical protein L0209_02215 [candidate division Zixibacteria bacterium]|nr:hypothetical protein [candidate division Zixibacteria bacterium]
MGKRFRQFRQYYDFASFFDQDAGWLSARWKCAVRFGLWEKAEWKDGGRFFSIRFFSFPNCAGAGATPPEFQKKLSFF